MKFSKYCIAAAAGLSVMLSGCSSTGDKQPVPEKKSEIVAITALDADKAAQAGRIMGEALLEAFKSKDFSKTAAVPVGDEKNRLTQEKFTKLLGNLDKAGGIAATGYLGDLAFGNFRRLLWKVSFNTKEKAPAADMIFEIVVVNFKDQYRVAGFGFRP